MCGRFASALKPSDAWLELMQDWSEELFSRYNVSPASQIGVFVDGVCCAMRWGLVPSWSKEISTKYATFNARIESIELKPAFRNAWRKDQKCLIPALGYYEWQPEQGVKQPYFVTSKDTSAGSQLMVFAGLWDECKFGDAALKSCSIITTESRSHLKELHSRMPVILSVDAAKHWLNASQDKAILLNENLTDFDIYKVDKRVNNSRQEDIGLIKPI
jgi:putative SOS response-associated peptidase YedK